MWIISRWFTILLCIVLIFSSSRLLSRIEEISGDEKKIRLHSEDVLTWSVSLTGKRIPSPRSSSHSILDEMLHWLLASWQSSWARSLGLCRLTTVYYYTDDDDSSRTSFVRRWWRRGIAISLKLLLLVIVVFDMMKEIILIRKKANQNLHINAHLVTHLHLKRREHTSQFRSSENSKFCYFDIQRGTRSASALEKCQSLIQMTTARICMWRLF